MDKLTKKQRVFFEELLDRYGLEPLPGFEKICIDLGFKSKNSVWQYFKKLLEHGFIKESNKRFFIPNDFIEKAFQGISYFESGVRAGFPTIAEDCMEEKISFDNLLVKNPVSTFSVRVVGDSMIEAGINEDDIVIVEKGKPPRNGDIVVASVDGEFTVKYYFKKGTDVYLEPANPNYQTIRAKQEMQIFGIVTGLVRKY